MKKGDFYPSSGVRLNDVRFDPEHAELALEIEGEPGVTYKTQFIGTRRDAVTRQHAEESQDATEGGPENRLEIDTTRVGVVLATATGETPTYRLQGDELYVRTIVTSSRPHPNPSYEDQFEQAWSQPVVWPDTRGE